MNKTLQIIKRFIGRNLAFIWSKSMSLLQTKKVRWHYEEIRQMNFSFSQFGEDIVIKNLLKNCDPAKSIYVDVGSFDPITFSNTLLLHKAGWKGVNIDLSASKINSFNIQRPSDCNLVAAISNQKKVAKLLTYSKTATDRIELSGDSSLTSVLGEQPVEIKEIETFTLTEVLNQSPFSKQPIHYLNIDCEGHDFQVLQSLDFEQYMPKVISIEIFEEAELTLVEAYLAQKGYVLDSNIHYTRLFVLRD